jgi:hypothetical protein
MIALAARLLVLKAAKLQAVYRACDGESQVCRALFAAGDSVHPVVSGRLDLNADVSPPVGEFVYGKSYLANSRSHHLISHAQTMLNRV